MSEDRITISLGLPELRVLAYEDSGTQHELRAEKVHCVVVCPQCGSKDVHSTGEERWRKIQDLPISGRPVWIELRQQRFLCERGHRFWERFDTVALSQRQTRRFQHWLLGQLRGSSVAEAVRRTGIGYRVLEWLLLKLGQQRASADRPWPKVLGVDEYASRKGQRYDTVVVDLKRHIVFEVGAGRSSKSLSSLWDDHPGKAKIRAAVIDMSRAFLSGLQTLGHRITIAIDRFHVEQHLFAAVDEVRRRLQREASPPEQKRLKAHRYLLRQSAEEVSPEEHETRSSLLADYPELALAVRLAEQVHQWYAKEQTISQARTALALWFVHVASSGIPEMMQATKALKEWIDYILNYFVLFLTNGTTEGLNTKIKLIIRLAFGLPSFPRRKARLLFQCGASP